ncbi:MAG: hypothetical protein ROO76_16825 [Terriglobia bacterium]|jgi:hypothetical protein|nr:hypothetical protein [Terriglobia bacterium]
MILVLLIPVWLHGQARSETGTQELPSTTALSRQSDGAAVTIFRSPDPVVVRPQRKKNNRLPNAPSYQASYQPLTPKQKFEYFADYAKSPFTFGSALVTAVSWQVYSDPPYGPGAAGFGESYAAALGQREIAALLERFVVPTAFHEDPRYFRAPPGENVVGRGMYAVSRLFLTKGDNGRDQINASYLLGGFASAAIGNAYIRNRGYGRVTQDFFLNMANDAAYNIAREFWPSVRPHFSKKLRKLGNILIGPQGLPNPQEKSPDRSVAKE